MSTEELTIPLSVERLPLPAARDLHAKLGELITKLEADLPTTYSVAAIDIVLAKGERYGGQVLNDDGTLSHHVVLLPGQATDVTWDDAKAWAASIGGELPTRQEQALLFANLKGKFEGRIYWSGTQSSSSSAWSQHFSNGCQGSNGKSSEFAARAVRRLFP